MSRMSVWLLLVAIFVPTITISATPSPWRLLSTLPHPSTPVSITFALHGSNESRTELERAHAEISDPTHARFRKYLNDDELDTLMTRPSSTVEPIRTWLHDSFHSTFNITHIHNTTHPDNNDAISVISSRWANYIVVTCNTTIMSTWLNTELVMYQHINHEHPIIAVDDAHLQNHSHPLGMMSSIIPSHLHQHIAYIVGVHELPMMIQANVHARKVKNSDGTLKGIPRKDDMPLTDLMTATQNVGDPEPPWQDDYIFSAQTDDRDVVLLLFATCPDRSTRATYSQGSYYCIMTDTQTYRLSAFNKMWKRDTDSEWSSEMMNKLYITPSDGSENDEHTVYVHHRIDDYHSYQFAVDMIWSSTSSSNQITLPVKYNHTVVAATRLLPAWLKAFYRFPYQATANNPNLIQAIGTMRVGMGPNVGGYYSPSDLHAFYDYADISRGNLDRVSFTGDTNDEYHPDLETQLDIQWISGMAPGARSIVWHTSRNAGSPFEDILGQIQNQPAEKRPHVLSFSYGADEYNYYKLNKAGANHINEMFMAFGVGGHGMTILFASGDSGAYNSVEGCSTMYRPFFPASSPYVLTVGATQLKNPRSNTSCPVEVACSISNAALITTGGGFSWYSPRPSWQNNVTSQYFNKSSTCYPQGTTRYNASGRGYPDISLLGHAYTVVHQGQQVSVDGTSASAPTLAGFLSMYNDLLLSAGKPTLGFVNPLLYHIASLHPEAFNDITEGDTTCLDQQRDSNHKYGNHCCRDGFKACKGWDPVSGLGSPNFEILGPYLLDGLSNFKGTIQEPYLQGCSPEPSRWSIYLILAIAAVSVILIALIACTVRRKYIKARSERQEALLSSRPGGHTIQSRGRTGSSSSWGVRPPTRDSQHERETRNRVLATRYTGMNQDMRQPLTTTTTSESNDDHSSSYVPPQQQQDIRMKAVRTPPLPDTVSTTEVVADTIPDRRIIAEARATRFQSRQG